MSQEISQILQTLERVLELNVHQSGEEVLENFVQKKNQKRSYRGLHLTRMLYSVAKIHSFPGYTKIRNRFSFLLKFIRRFPITTPFLLTEFTY